MPLQFDIVHLFIAPQGYLVEVRRLDLPTTAPKCKRYHWLWIEDGTVSSLLFVSLSMNSDQRRTFEDASLSFDDFAGELHWTNGRTVALKPAPGTSLPAPLKWLVHEHLS